MIDRAVIDSLRELNQEGEPDVVQEVLTLFLEDAPGRIAAIAGALERRDAASLQRAAHAFKGAAGNIGARELQGHCQRLEALAKAESLDGADTLLRAIREEFEQVNGEAREILRS